MRNIIIKIGCVTCLCLFNIFVWGQEMQISYTYPSMDPEIYTESFFGKQINDPYHHLSEKKNPNIDKWYEKQDSLAEQYFNQNKIFDDYLAKFRLLEVSDEGEVSMIRKDEKGNYFFLRYNSEKGREILITKTNLSADEKEILDPESFGSISYLKPSHDGNFLAIGFAKDFSTTIHIFNVITCSFTGEVITNINPEYGGIEWLPNSKGFIYLYFPDIDPESENFKRGSFSVLHKLGEDTGLRRNIFGRDNNISVPDDFFPKVKINSSKEKFIVGYVSSSDDYYDSYIAKVEDSKNYVLDWKPFYKVSDQIYYDQGEVKGSEYIFRQGTVSGNILGAVNIYNPDFKDPKILAVGSTEIPLVDFAVTKDNIYYTQSKYGVEVELFQIDSTNQKLKIDLPFKPGYLSFYGKSSLHNQIGIGIDGWLSSYKRYTLIEGIPVDEPLDREKEQKFEDLVSYQVLIPSYDGEEVPLSLIHNRDLNFNSENKVFIFVYGAYGESMTPFYSPIFLEWVARGGILAFPHVRGGGEKGKEWHLAGMKALKSNSWKDLIACTEALIEQKFTRKGLISLYTASAGGITAGMAVNEQPDLFSSFIADVPRLNPVGLEAASSPSSSSFLEYGSIRDSVEFSGLLKMDPYLNLIREADYPATLIFPSYEDDRIPLSDGGKYIAKLQKLSDKTKPILLDINYGSGHDSNGPSETSILYGKIFSFAESNMR